MTTSGYPTFLTYIPCELRFGTSCLRGLVREMTILEVYINTRGFLDYLHQIGDVGPGDPIALAQDLREVDPSSRSSVAKPVRVEKIRSKRRSSDLLHGRVGSRQQALRSA